MNGILLAMQGAVSQGILWSVMALGIYITFRLLDIADLSVDGTFALGGCTMAALVTVGVDPLIATICALVAGALGGCLTGILTTKCKIPSILAGILTQLSLYSINLRIMGRSNLPMLKLPTIFKNLMSMTGLSSNEAVLIVGLIIAAIVVAVMYWFFGTETGSAIRATGSNESMVRSLGVNTDTTKIIGLAISNALVALSGALVSQSQGYADVKQGIGAIVIGLASIIIGETMIRKHTNFALRLGMIVLGSVIYRLVIAIVLQLGLNTDDLKLFSAILVAVFLTVPTIMDSRRRKTGGVKHA
ncbi:MAG: ABC transporter permease [Solobacterium sp.]|jgi:putative ABC transport system permease protein|nr:ABC transporter permease [Solobacterium sp.]MCH4223318.1 ABC transporter permease [Solobacterium sp.]MCH4266386.1 ABC transporter permease [Solobacterium sp.]